MVPAARCDDRLASHRTLGDVAVEKKERSIGLGGSAADAEMIARRPTVAILSARKQICGNRPRVVGQVVAKPE